MEVLKDMCLKFVLKNSTVKNVQYLSKCTYEASQQMLDQSVGFTNRLSAIKYLSTIPVSNCKISLMSTVFKLVNIHMNEYMNKPLVWLTLENFIYTKLPQYFV